MGKNLTPAQQAKRLEKLERGKRAVELKRLGASFRQIAEKLKEEGIECSHVTVKRDFDEAMAVYVEDHKEEMESFVAMQNMRLSGMFMNFHIMTQPRTKTVEDEKTKEKITKTIEPSIGAGWLCVAILRLWNETNGVGNLLRHEHSGKVGVEMEAKVYAGFDPDKV